MLLVQRSTNDSPKCTLNILPCRIHHNGPTKVTKRYWMPTTGTDGSRTAYFRGRKLKGKRVSLPFKYQGLILHKSGQVLQQPPRPPTSQHRPSLPQYENEEEDDDDDEIHQSATQEPTKIIQEVSKFDNVVVWGHDQVPAADDLFVNGIEEWISFAGAINGSSAILCHEVNMSKGDA